MSTTPKPHRRILYRQTAFAWHTVPDPLKKKKKTSQFDIFKHLIRTQYRAYSAYSVRNYWQTISNWFFFPRTVSQTDRTVAPRIVWLGNLCQCGSVCVQIIIILWRGHAVPAFSGINGFRGPSAWHP